MSKIFLSNSIILLCLSFLFFIFCTDITRENENDPDNPNYIKNSISIIIDSTGIDTLDTESKIRLGITCAEDIILERIQNITFTFAPGAELKKEHDGAPGYNEIWLDSTYTYNTVGEKKITLFVKTINNDDIYDSININIGGVGAYFKNKTIDAPTEAVFEDTSVTLSVKGKAGGTDSLKYQWYKDTSFSDSTWSNALENQIYETCNLTSITLEDSGYYFCIVNNLYGSDTSEKVFLDIKLIPVDSNAPVVFFTESAKSGNENTNGTIAVGLSKQSDEEVSVVCQLSNSSTATQGVDHVFKDYKVVFSSGEVIKSVPIGITDDNLKESSENVALVLTTPRKCRLHSDSINEFIHTILDNDESFVGFSSSSFSGSEDSSVTIRDSIPVILSALNSVPVTVDFSVLTTSTAEVGEGKDYKIIGTQTITFPAFKDTAYIALDLFDDELIEGDENIVLALNNPTGGIKISSADSLCTYTIRDNDIVTIAFNVAQADSISENAGVMSITVSLSKVSENRITVNYQATDITAQGNGVDYGFADTTKSIVFEPGDPSKEITLNIINDSQYEGDETFSINLINPSANAILGTNSSFTSKIIDDEKLNISFSEPILEGAESVTKVFVPVTLSEKPLKNMSIDFVALQSSIATIDVDFSIVTESPITFISGDTTTKQIEVSIVNDKIDELNELFYIKLDKPINATIGEDSIFSYNLLDDDYTVKVTSAGNGTVTPDESQVVSQGDSIAITATADEHYHFIGWTLTSGLTVKNSAASLTVINNISDSGTVTANFTIDSFTVQVSAGENGNLTGAGDIIVPYNGVINVSGVTADPNYVFNKWVVTGNVALDDPADSSNINALFRVTGAGTIKATFKLQEYEIEVLKIGNGSLDQNGIVKVSHGGSLTINATADSNYHLVKWESDSFDVGVVNEVAKVIENITKNGTITAFFAIDTHTVTITAGLNGSVTTSGGDEIVKYVAHGDSIDIEAYADEHYHFLSWTNQNSLEIVDTTKSVTKVKNVTADGVFIANFEVDSHAINVSVKNGQSAMGSTSPTETNYYDYGQEVTVTATSSVGSKFAFWEIGSGGTSDNNPYTFTVSANESITANFESVLCTLSIAATQYGSVPLSSIVVPYNNDTAITINPERGCRFNTWTNPEGFTISDEGEGKYRISGVTKNGSLTANYEIIPPVDGVVYVDKNANSNGAKDGTSWYNAYTSFTKALDSTTTGKTFWVAEGVYTPVDGMEDPYNRTLKFILQSGDTIVGGFNGFNTSIPSSDSVFNISTLSGDIGELGSSSDNSGLLIRTNSNAIIRNFTIQDAGDDSKNGNAFDVWGDGTLIENCIIQKILGSGIKINAHDVHIKNCVFIDNKADQGAGIYMYSTLFNSWKNILIENSLFINNETSAGGAIYSNSNTKDVKYVNCTIAYNNCTGDFSAGIHNEGNDTLINCIIYGNTVSNASFAGTQLYKANLVFRCNIQDESGLGIGSKILTTGSTTILDVDPHFLGQDYIGEDQVWYTDDDELHLDTGSPCKNQGGSPTSINTDLPIGDIMHRNRVLAGGVDMGAYEQ